MKICGSMESTTNIVGSIIIVLCSYVKIHTHKKCFRENIATNKLSENHMSEI